MFITLTATKINLIVEFFHWQGGAVINHTHANTRSDDSLTAHGKRTYTTRARHS